MTFQRPRDRTSRAAAVVLGCLLVLLLGSISVAVANDLAVANGDWLRVVNAETGARVRDVNRYAQVMRLDYRPDGQRLAVGVCFGNRIVELETAGYAEVGVPITASGCPWDVSYAPGSRALAATVPVRPNPLGAMTGHLRIAGVNPLDRQVGYPLGALAWRPDGAHLAMVTPLGVDILGPGPAYTVVASSPGVVYALAYTTDGSRLILGTPGGFEVLDATSGYTVVSSDTGSAVRHIAVAPSGTWVAMLRSNAVSVRRSVDLVEVANLVPGGTLRAAEFSRDGTMLAVAESRDRVHRYQVPSWSALGALATPGRVDAIAFRPAPTQVAARIPVLFVHGYTSGSVATWIDPGTLTSFAEAHAANPQLPLDAFHLELPPRGSLYPQNFGRSIADDATDILAAIEGGLDSGGRTQVGILDMPAYRKVGRVALVGFSMGTISSRYYLKNLMGDRRNGAITVSEFVALAPPNHGVAVAGLTVICDDPAEPDKSLRQLCGGYQASLVTAVVPCPCIPPLASPFTSNTGDDATFLIDLNGHDLTDSCSANSYASEAPSSRPSTPGGVLYAAFYAANEDDLGIGGDVQGGDCLGRHLARNMSDEAENKEIVNIPGGSSAIHENTPHFWDTICMTLRTIVDHAVPADQVLACQGLTQP